MVYGLKFLVTHFGEHALNTLNIGFLFCNITFSKRKTGFAFCNITFSKRKTGFTFCNITFSKRKTAITFCWHTEFGILTDIVKPNADINAAVRLLGC